MTATTLPLLQNPAGLPEAVLDLPFVRNRIERLLIERGLRLRPELYVKIGFNARTWGMALKNDHVLTQRQVAGLVAVLGLNGPVDLFEPITTYCTTSPKNGDTE